MCVCVHYSKCKEHFKKDKCIIAVHMYGIIGNISVGLMELEVISLFKITLAADGDCSHEIKRCLLLGRKVMTNLDRY